MPIVNGKYKNPGWLNNQRPAINAAELNAISDTLAALDAQPPLPSLTNPGTASDLLAGKQLIDANGNVLTGTIPSQAGATITPGTAAKTAVAAGRYTTGAVMVAGDNNLVSENIKSGVSIFGITGNYSGAQTNYIVVGPQELGNGLSYPFYAQSVSLSLSVSGSNTQYPDLKKSFLGYLGVIGPAPGSITNRLEIFKTESNSHATLSTGSFQYYGTNLMNISVSAQSVGQTTIKVWWAGTQGSSEEFTINVTVLA